MAPKGTYVELVDEDKSAKRMLLELEFKAVVGKLVQAHKEENVNPQRKEDVKFNTGKTLKLLGREFLFNELIDVVSDVVNFIVLSDERCKPDADEELLDLLCQPADEDTCLSTLLWTFALLVMVSSLSGFAVSLYYQWEVSKKREEVCSRAYNNEHYPEEVEEAFMHRIKHRRMLGAQLVEVEQQEAQGHLISTILEDIPSSVFNFFMVYTRGVTSGTQLTTLIISLLSFMYRVCVKGYDDFQMARKPPPPPDQKFEGHDQPVRSVAVFPNGDKIITGSMDKTARIWPAAGGQSIAVLEGHTNVVWSVAVFPGGDKIVTGSEDMTARIWPAAGGESIAVLEGHTDWVFSVAVFPGGDKIVTGSRDKTARIWLAAGGQSIAVLEGHTGFVRSVAVFPGGDKIITGSYDNTARIWPAAGGQSIAVLEGHTDQVTSVAVFPGGDKIVTGSKDETARIWLAAGGQSIAVLEGHTDRVMSVAVFPGGDKIVTGSDDKTARVWSAMDGKLLVVLNGHTDRVWSVAVFPGGDKVVTGSTDTKAFLWDL